MTSIRFAGQYERDLSRERVIYDKKLQVLSPDEIIPRVELFEMRRHREGHKLRILEEPIFGCVTVEITDGLRPYRTTIDLADYGILPNKKGLWNSENWLKHDYQID